MHLHSIRVISWRERISNRPGSVQVGHGPASICMIIGVCRIGTASKKTQYTKCRIVIGPPGLFYMQSLLFVCSGAEQASVTATIHTGEGVREGGWRRFVDGRCQWGYLLVTMCRLQARCLQLLLTRFCVSIALLLSIGPLLALPAQRLA